MMSDIRTISPETLAEVRSGDAGFRLIDVRTPAEFREVHVEAAVNEPLDKLDPAAVWNARESTPDPLYVICKSGARGRQACAKFHAAGFKEVVNVDGGTDACVAAGLPLVRGKKTMSLERQVRITAGSLVVLGVVLGFVHPAFLGISAFIGAGLVFAGVTDTCGMGMMLSKMPWNRVG